MNYFQNFCNTSSSSGNSSNNAKEEKHPPTYWNINFPIVTLPEPPGSNLATSSQGLSGSSGTNGSKWLYKLNLNCKIELNHSSLIKIHSIRNRIINQLKVHPFIYISHLPSFLCLVPSLVYWELPPWPLIILLNLPCPGQNPCYSPFSS